MTAPTDLPTTLGALRASGHRERSIKAELRENLLAALAGGGDVWPGIFGFSPQEMRVYLDNISVTDNASAKP